MQAKKKDDEFAQAGAAVGRGAKAAAGFVSDGLQAASSLKRGLMDAAVSKSREAIGNTIGPVIDANQKFLGGVTRGLGLTRPASPAAAPRIASTPTAPAAPAAAPRIASTPTAPAAPAAAPRIASTPTAPAAPAAAPRIASTPTAPAAPAPTQGAAPAATGTARVLGQFNGRDITVGESDRLAGQLNTISTPGTPARGLSRPAAPALSAATDFAGAAPPALVRPARANGITGVGFRGTGGQPAYGTDAKSQIDSELFRIGIQGANTRSKRQLVGDLLGAKARLEGGAADRATAAQLDGEAGANQIAQANAAAINQQNEAILQRRGLIDQANAVSQGRISEQALANEGRINEQGLANRGRLAEQELANRGALDVALTRGQEEYDPRAQIAALDALRAKREQILMFGGKNKADGARLLAEFDNGEDGKMLASLMTTLANNGAQQAGAPQLPPAPPKVGAEMDGYRFKGGDPADPANWEAAR